MIGVSAEEEDWEDGKLRGLLLRGCWELDCWCWEWGICIGEEGGTNWTILRGVLTGICGRALSATVTAIAVNDIYAIFLPMHISGTFGTTLSSRVLLSFI